jgi:hypothetical protein
MRSLLLDVGCWNNLSGEVEPFAEVVETLWGESVVVVLPRELSLDVSTGGQRLASLDDEEVLGSNICVCAGIFFLCDEDTLTEEVFVDLLSVCLWDKPRKTIRSGVNYCNCCIGISHFG